MSDADTMQSPPTQPPKSPRFSRRFLRNVLIASLALNLLLIGGFAGAKWMRHHGSPLDRVGRGLHAYSWTLESARGDEIRDMLKKLRRDMKSRRKGVRQKMHAVRDIISAEPFDRQKSEETMIEALQARHELRRDQALNLLTVIEKLTPEERATFVKWRFRKHRRWHKHHHRNDD